MIQSLVTDDLMTLGPDDSLVLFYAGHGGTRKHRLGNQVIKTGYLIPVDASDSPDKVSTWIDLEGWLRAVSLLPAKHILVVLDACHSGIALDPILKSPADAQALPARPQPTEPLSGDCLAGMVPVPAGTFRMGSPDGVGDTDEHPQHEVTLSAYCIDKTEVTVKAYAACVTAKGCSAAPRTVKWSEYSADDVKLYSQFCNGDYRPDHPINCVDWDQAAAYCKWAEKRLPTEAEWEYAARGRDGRAYPWGNEPPSATRLNACGTECVAMAKLVLKRDWVTMYNASDGYVTTAPVGNFPEGTSPFGALDMAGNVWEWTADWYGDYTNAAATNPRGAVTGTARVGRGGGWYGDVAGNIRVTARNNFDASFRHFFAGFRCARGN